MTYSLSDRVAVVTGSTAGIGLAIAREVVALGGGCVLNGRREARLREVVAEVGARAVNANHVRGVAGDASDDAVIERLLDAGRDEVGPRGREADLIVLNAGRGLKGSVMDSDTAQWDEMIRTNLLGVARLIRAAGNRLLAEIKREHGDTPSAAKVLSRPRDLIVIGSIVGKHVSPFSSMYGATKFGVHGLVEGARRELGPKGIRVTLVAPGFVTSEFQGVAGYDPKWYEGVVERIGPVLSPEDVARLVGFIASQPPAVQVGDVVIRPVRQDYP
jgi:NADP-dependent 3-hydroxy acid dehydrogenase YdfG